ncbi:MAG: phosphocholine cytidylyltransferase family protein [Nanoarchaeota archaeon]
MKALISAAGKGTRLGELTKNTNKCLLQIGGKPLLRHTVETLKKQGINEIYVITGYYGEKIKEELGDLVHYVYNPNYAETNILGSIILAKEHLIDSEFLFITGDSLVHPDILKKILDAEGDIAVLIELKQCDDEDMKVIIDEHKITQMSKNIPCNLANGEYTGITLFSKKSSKTLFTEIEDSLQIKNSQYLAEILLLMQQKGHHLNPIYSENIPRIEIDYPEDLKKAQQIYEKIKQP